MPSKISGTTTTELLTSLVRSILDGNSLDARAWARQLALQSLTTASRNERFTPQEEVLAAALLELLAERTNQSPPAWTADVQGAAEPVFLLRSATRFPNLRRQCLAESPEPLRRRNLFAPADYLTWA